MIGDLIFSRSWTGTPGAPTSGEPLQIGRYYNYPNTFQGEIDKVTLWNRALPSGEIKASRVIAKDWLAVNSRE